MLCKHLHPIIVFTAFFNLMSVKGIAENTVEASPIAGLSVGVDLGTVAGNLTHGVRIASPSFFNGFARAAWSGYFGWMQNAMSITDTSYSWLPFGLFKLGIHLGSFVEGLPLRISSFVNAAMVTPSLKISSKSVIFGLDGGLDTEVFISTHRMHAVTFTLGGLGLFSPTADGVKGRPSFANGFTIAGGYRYYF